MDTPSKVFWTFIIAMEVDRNMARYTEELSIKWFIYLSISFIAILVTNDVNGAGLKENDNQLIKDTRKIAHMMEEQVNTSAIFDVIRVKTVCNIPIQMETGPCSDIQAIVPFTLFGPGSGVWSYVARFRARNKDMLSGQANSNSFVLMEIIYIPLQLGIVDWRSAKVSGNSVALLSHVWKSGDAHSQPSLPISLVIKVGNALTIEKIP